MFKSLVASIFCLFFSLSALAVDFEPGMEEYGAQYYDLIPKAPLGGVNWKTLFSIGEKEVVEGGLTYYKPLFSPAVKKLGGKKIKVNGFMFPLDMTENQKHFLLSAFPPSCPFHAPGGPKHIIEVYVEDGIEFTYDPLIIEGELELLEFDKEEGLYYRMSQAKEVKK